MILCDPPYAITANKWDKPLDLEKMFKEYDRIIKDNGAIVLFGNQPFTTDLINAYRKNFRYSLVWDKNLGTDFFNCNKKPLKSHEDILIFYKKQPTYNPQKEEGKPYNNTRNENIVFQTEAYNAGQQGYVRKVDKNHSTSERFPKSVIKVDYTDNDEYEMTEHEDILIFYKKQPTYNPQKEEGKPYIDKRQGTHNYKGIESKDFERRVMNNNGTRFPKSILKFKRETGKHTTQKPVKLCEWLISTYTNEGETVLDNTMGSGTTGVACMNTKRKFIGFELDEKYFKVAVERIEGKTNM